MSNVFGNTDESPHAFSRIAWEFSVVLGIVDRLPVLKL